MIIIDLTNMSHGWQAELYNESDKLLSWAINPIKEIAILHATLIFLQKCPECTTEAIEKMILKLQED